MAMKYQILSDEQISVALQKVLKEARSIQSQSLLKKLVVDEFKKKKKKIGLTPHRLRRIALKNSHVSLEIHSREGDPDKILQGCPVCDHPLKKVKNLTIWGGVVTIEFSCPYCGYWTGKKKRIPTRYIFHYKD